MEAEPSQALTVQIVPSGRADVQIVKLEGPLTIHNFVQFQDVTKQQPLPKLLLVDLSDVPYIDSAAMGSFVGIHVNCEHNNTRYALIGANERLMGLFQLTNTRDFLVLYPSIELALHALQ